MRVHRPLTGLAALAILAGCADLRDIALEDVACMGHRGHVSESHLENTLGAFLAAYNLGADGTEMDVYHTDDNIAMVFHDRTLATLATAKPGQSCPKNQGIADLTYAELSQRCQLVNGDEIPTLESVFQQFSQTDFRLYLEFKDAIHPDTLELAETHYPEPAGRLQGTSFLKDVLKPPFSSFGTPFPLMLAHRRYVAGMETGFDGVDVGAIPIPDIERLQQRGKRVGLYGVDTATDIRRALDARVNYITTDRLPLCVQLKREALDARD